MSPPAGATSSSPFGGIQPVRSIRGPVRLEAVGQPFPAGTPRIKGTPHSFWRAVGHRALGRQGQSQDVQRAQGCHQVCQAPSLPYGTAFLGPVGYLRLALVSLVLQGQQGASCPGTLLEHEAVQPLPAKHRRATGPLPGLPLLLAGQAASPCCSWHHLSSPRVPLCIP